MSDIELVPYPELGELVLAFTPSHIDLLDPGPRMLLPQPANDLLNAVLLALEACLHRTVWKVLHPTGDALLIREPPGVVTEVDTLDDSSEPDIRSNFHCIA
jgi:hypothetical protein